MALNPCKRSKTTLHPLKMSILPGKFTNPLNKQEHLQHKEGPLQEIILRQGVTITQCIARDQVLLFQVLTRISRDLLDPIIQNYGIQKVTSACYSKAMMMTTIIQRLMAGLPLSKDWMNRIIRTQVLNNQEISVLKECLRLIHLLVPKKLHYLLGDLIYLGQEYLPVPLWI
nr:non-structural C protein [Feline morbillivirus]